VIRAVVDVNVLISALLGPLGFSRRVLLLWQAGAFRPLVSDGIVREVGKKLRLPRIARRYSVSDDERRWFSRC
jgi:predicted nucleic acid-binding protein